MDTLRRLGRLLGRLLVQLLRSTFGRLAVADAFFTTAATRAAPAAPSWWTVNPDWWTDEPHQVSRALDLLLLGHQLATVLAPSQRDEMLAVWRERIVPCAAKGESDWIFGATARVQGLKSAPAFNGRVGRISSHAIDEGRWEVMVDGPDGIGTVNLRPNNLGAPPSLAAVLATARRLPGLVQVAGPPPDLLHATAAKTAAAALNFCPPITAKDRPKAPLGMRWVTER